MSDSVPTGPTIDHATYLGASDIGVVVDENHMARDQSDVYAEKKGYSKFVGTTETELGNEFERPMLKVWAAKYEVVIDFPGTLLHPVDTWAGATADGYILAWEAALEAKIVGFKMQWHWGPASDGAEGVPAAVVIQVHWQAWVLRANGFVVSVGIVVACIGTELRTYEFPIDDELIAALVDEGRDWWQHHIVGDVRPPGRAGRAIVSAIHPANVRPELDPITEKVLDLALAYHEAREAEKEAKKTKEYLGFDICDAIGDGSGMYGEGVKATWKRSEKTGKRSVSVTVKGG